MQINITFDSSVANAPAGFKPTILAVANYYASTFGDPSTLNLNVGYGEVGGTSLPTGALGASSTYLASLSYANLVSALKLDASSANDYSAVTNLGSDPTGGRGHYWVSTAEAKALGFSLTNSTDGSIGFSSSANFFYDPTHTATVPTGNYDFFGTVAHEFSEVMGRMLLTGGRVGFYHNSYSALDLFHYSAQGVHDLSGTKAGYFSIDGGATNLHNFNTNSLGDYGDWASPSNAPADAFNAFASSGVIEPVSSSDVTALDAIGWSLAGTTSAGGTTFSGGGTVTYSQHASGAAEAHAASASGDHAWAAELAALNVGQGLLKTDLSFYYGA
jgi:hypothetical protein